MTSEQMAAWKKGCDQTALDDREFSTPPTSRHIGWYKANVGPFFRTLPSGLAIALGGQTIVFHPRTHA